MDASLASSLHLGFPERNWARWDTLSFALALDVELEFILDLSEFIRGSNALHKSKPFVFPVHLLPNGLSFTPDATVIFSRFFAFFSSLRNDCTLWDLNPGPFFFFR